jgi:hypothetical protein
VTQRGDAATVLAFTPRRRSLAAECAFGVIDTTVGTEPGFRATSVGRAASQTSAPNRIEAVR